MIEFFESSFNLGIYEEQRNLILVARENGYLEAGQLLNLSYLFYKLDCLMARLIISILEDDPLSITYLLPLKFFLPWHKDRRDNDHY